MVIISNNNAGYIVFFLVLILLIVYYWYIILPVFGVIYLIYRNKKIEKSDKKMTKYNPKTEIKMIMPLPLGDKFFTRCTECGGTDDRLHGKYCSFCGSNKLVDVRKLSPNQKIST